MCFVCIVYSKKLNMTHNILFYIKIASNMGLGSNFIFTQLKVNVIGKKIFYLTIKMAFLEAGT